jgi:hypothetical protein
MASGDWVTGSYIVILSGSLPELAAGEAGAAEVTYNIVLPSGGTVLNGGSSGLAPFSYQADDTQPISSGAMALVVALAQHENLPVHLTTTIVNPDGTTSPITS